MSRTSPSAPWNFYFMVAGVKVGVEDSGPPCRPKGGSRLTPQLRRAAPKACASIDELRWERKKVVKSFYFRVQGAHRGATVGDAALSKLHQKLKQFDKDIADKMQKVS